MNIISGDDATKKAVQLISKKYKLFKVLVLINTETKSNYLNIINQIEASVKSVVVLEFLKTTTEQNVVSGLIKQQLSEDVGLIINFCSENIFNVAVQVCGQIKTLTFLTEPNINLFLTKSSYLIIDYNLISLSSNKAVANCYGKLCAYAFYLLEEVFNKAVFGLNYGAENLLEIEKVLQNLMLIPGAILKTSMGKTLLTNVCLKLKNLIEINRFNNSFVNTLSNLLMRGSKYKSLTKGEALIISSTLCFKMFNVLVNAKNLSHQHGFNCYTRILNAKRANTNFSFSKVTKSFFCNSELESYISNFFKIKSTFVVVFNTYQAMFKKLLNTFKSLYLDRTVCLNKFLNFNNLLLSVSVVPEQFTHPCLATFIRDVGLLNKLNV